MATSGPSRFPRHRPQPRSGMHGGDLAGVSGVLRPICPAREALSGTGSPAPMQIRPASAASGSGLSPTWPGLHSGRHHVMRHQPQNMHPYAFCPDSRGRQGPSSPSCRPDQMTYDPARPDACLTRAPAGLLVLVSGGPKALVIGTSGAGKRLRWWAYLCYLRDERGSHTAETTGQGQTPGDGPPGRLRGRPAIAGWRPQAPDPGNAGGGKSPRRPYRALG